MSSPEALLPDPSPVVLDGTRIATWVLEPRGTARGDVVLCHGTPWSAQVWGRVARELSREHRVFLWDMPGYGASEMRPDIATDLRTQADRFVALMSQWGLERPHVVAHDIGGAVALRAHLLHGADFADLFVWDIVTLDPWGSPFFRLVAEHVEVFTQLPSALHDALVAEYIAGSGPRSLSTQQVGALVASWRGATGQVAFYRQIAGLRPEHTRPVVDRLGALRCPVRIGWGEADRWIPVRQAYELQARLPGNPEVVTLAGVGHLAPVEDPAGVTAALRDWLDR